MGHYAPCDLLAKSKARKATGLALNGMTHSEESIQASIRERDILHVRSWTSNYYVHFIESSTLGISKQPNAASFVRPTRPIDKGQSFLEALHQKYASEFEEEREKKKAFEDDKKDFQMNDVIKFNGKVVEEVGFEKIRKQLAALQELKVVLLDGLRIAGVLSNGSIRRDDPRYDEELQSISRTCPRIIELDLSRNLLYHWQDVQDICKQLTRLKSLKLK